MDSGRTSNTRGRGRGRGGGGRGHYQNQGADGRGHYQNQGAGGRGNYQNQGAGGRGNYQNQGAGERGNYQNQGRVHHSNPPNQGGGRGSNAPHIGAQPKWVCQPPAQQAWGYRPPQPPLPQLAHPQGRVPPVTCNAGAWTGRQWGQSTTAASPVPPFQTDPQPSADTLGIETLKISEHKPQSSSSEGKEDRKVTFRRPDRGGTLSTRSIRLLVNHFPVDFDSEKTIIHYDVDVKPVSSNGNTLVKSSVRRSDLRLIRDKLFSDPKFQIMSTAYDGEKNIFSAVRLPTGSFVVDISDGNEGKGRSFIFTLKFVNELRLSKLREYIKGNISYIPRDILQGMDVVMKENPSRHRICIGRSFYSPNYRREDDLYYGLAAHRGFQQSLKPTSQGLALCLDYSVLAFRKPLPVIDFLKEHIEGFEAVKDVIKFRRQVNSALKGLKVTVVHRLTKQKYTVAGLTEEVARDIYFDLVDPEGQNPTQRIGLIKYFKDKWGKDIKYQNIPCLELGKVNKSNKVPIEFCVLVEGQRYANEHLDKDTALLLKKITLAKPWDRRNTIDGMLRADDGPCGLISTNFGIRVDANMTKVVGRVIGAPELKVGSSRPVRVDVEKCQWNLLGKSFVDGKSVDRWALLDFTDGDRYNKLQVNAFINNLRGRCRNLGIHMEEPLLQHATRMHEFSSVNRLEKLLKHIVVEAGRINNGKLQMIVCVMTKRDPGYRLLKWVSETQIGVVTQCCLSPLANKGNDQYLANLCLKINAKLGGSNFELIGKLPHFDNEDLVMFIGADVNHPGPMNPSCPSIAAVVASVNWPAVNRYAARISPQAHRTEKIVNFGAMCVDLVNTYARINKDRPRKIVVFRDGVSEGQFEMILSEELFDMKKAFEGIKYKPMITLVVAQKRHQTRLFVENRNDGGASGNVPPGTVVDTTVVHPFDFDFYLCSHYGGLGTSKPTHYYVLHDENSFTSDELQKLIYDMCFTYARCTKPVSLVPPVYYADLVAYRGRMFQEVVLETQSPQSASPHASTSTSTPSFDKSFYSLHPDLQDFMFFL